MSRRSREEVFAELANKRRRAVDSGSKMGVYVCAYIDPIGRVYRETARRHVVHIADIRLGARYFLRSEDKVVRSLFDVRGDVVVENLEGRYLPMGVHSWGCSRYTAEFDDIDAAIMAVMLTRGG